MTNFLLSTGLGEKIRLARKRAGLTQARLAKEMEITQGSISQFEKEITTPDKTTLIRLAQVLQDDLGIPWLTKHATKPYEELAILGKVCAGRGIDAHTDPDAPTINIPSMLVRIGESFCLKVKGESMVGDGIFDGDVLVVRRQSQAEVGQVVIALHEGQVYVRRLAIKRPRIFLASSNPKYPPLEVAPGEEFEIQAVVTGLVRSYGDE